MITMCVFFVKQKTAYEMRISDWSSDVCSSDLRRTADQRVGHRSPEYGVCEGNEGQHGGKCGQDNGPRALHRGFDDGVIVIEAGSTVQIGRAPCRERVCQYV